MSGERFDVLIARGYKYRRRSFTAACLTPLSKGMTHVNGVLGAIYCEACQDQVNVSNIQRPVSLWHPHRHRSKILRPEVAIRSPSSYPRVWYSWAKNKNGEPLAAPRLRSGVSTANGSSFWSGSKSLVGEGFGADPFLHLQSPVPNQQIEEPHAGIEEAQPRPG
jgi:hypothetical protein